MKKFISNLIVTIICSLWYFYEPGWESAVSSISSIIVLISQFLWNNDLKKIIRKKLLTQKAGARSKQYQAGGSMIVHDQQSKLPNRKTVNATENITEMTQEAGDDSVQFQSGENMIIGKDE